MHVQAAESRLLVMVLDSGSGPITGSVHEPCGDTRAFSGWLELSALLESLRGVNEPARSAVEAE